ncbi:hypothetical protein G3580_14050 [Nitrogeniibacter mangrovi]|uniref:PH (Pleckstrin Homology) domain-containing protein n=1 Tax=Nitrogeniibacter mangrovi TaxID=2016596 RepID=A0A6C1B4L6_9RHOO|nr:hypothetical protein [Nitrogeniibacter mangrovi]QID18646.1 hypothetical protein G3580_14050 [Nitrogeniibacter mangrovi]
MSVLFRYVRSRRRTAANLVAGMGVLPLWLWLLATLGAGRQGLDAFMAVAVPAVWGVEILLGLAVVWLLTHPDRFEMTVTPERFAVHHPLFSEWTFSIDPAQIVRIEHRLDLNQFTRIRIHTRDGRTLSLCKNYPYSRQRLYDALRSANPRITFPSRIGHFSRT